MEINKKKFVVDSLMFIIFLAVVVSGFVLWLVLPRGLGRTGSSFVFSREIWIFVHN